VSSRDALAAALTHLASLDDPAVVIARVPEEWLHETAARIDAAPAHEVPLRGTTFAVKANIDVAGLLTTAACPSFGAHRGPAASSATVVDRLVQAGALPVFTTNLDQFATGLVGTRSPSGTPRNPYHPGLVPGGSSSGSAVAVATGMVTFALGTDTAGSGRVPAAMCGIVGLKPTRGWLSIHGVVPAVRSIDCVSVFARDAGFAWRVASIAGGFDALDPMSRPVPPSSRASARTVGRVGDAVLDRLGVSDHVRAGCEASCRALIDAGCTVVEVDVQPLLDIGALLYGGPWVAERFASVGDHLSGDPDDADPVVRSIILAAQRLSAVDAFQASYRLSELRLEVNRLFERIDVLVTPTIARAATIAEVLAEPIAANERMGWFTTFSNLADLCALAVPVGVAAADGPPASITLHGPAWADEALVNTAAVLQGRQEPASAPRGWTTLAVAGAHLRGQPLEHQLVDRGAVWLGTTATSDDYALYAVAGTVPPKPGLVRVPDGRAIEIDTWALRPDAFGDFVAAVPPPLCIGTVELADHRSVPGFLCEPRALDGATDITAFGGWRAYRAGT
jgi:allophanate hydrolase